MPMPKGPRRGYVSKFIGRVYGRLAVKERIETARKGAQRFRCECSCGVVVEVDGGNLPRTNSCGRNRVPRWSTTSDVASHFPQFHYKVVMAKLRSAIRRKIIDGCACGCRGDFEVPGDKMIALQDVNGRQLTEWAWWDGGEVRVDAIASGAPRWLLVDDGRSVKRVWFTP